MRIPTLHRWPRTAKAAISLQRSLAGAIQLNRVSADVRRFGGVDVAFSPDGTQVVAGVVVWDADQKHVIESRVARRPCRFPYVPGLLSFRELPAVLSALAELTTKPQAILCDGQGYAHPRRCGLASHLGLWLGLPTIGCAKSRLCGEFNEPACTRGAHSPLMHDGEQVGVVLRTRDGVNPLFVSPGHLCDIDSAIRLTLAAGTRFRLPEPTRLAHQLVTRERTTTHRARGLASAPRSA